MPLPTSAKWDRVRNDLAAREHAILKVTDGTDTWLFSDIEMNLTDGHVYNTLKSWGDITSGCDIFSRKWLAQNIQVRLSNHNYTKADSADGWKRLGDDLAGIYGRDAEIYLLKGDDIDALSDCLKRFSGKVGVPPSYDADFVTITLVSKQKYIDKQLPSTFLNTIYTTPLPDDVTKKIPLVYGQFTSDFNEPQRSGLGLAVTIMTTRGGESYVVADHILKAFTNTYGLPPQVMEVVELDTPTLNVNSAGRGRMTATGNLVNGKFYPTHTDDDDYDTTPEDAAVTNAVDRNTTTSVQVQTYEFGSGSVAPKALMMLGFSIGGLLAEIADDSHTKYKLSTHCDDNPSYLVTVNVRRFYFYNDLIYSDVYMQESMPLSDAYDDSSSWRALPNIVLPTLQTANTATTGYRFTSITPTFGVNDDLNDMTTNNVYTGSAAATWDIEIDGSGTPDTFKWRKNAESYTTGVSITGSAQLLKEGVEITFNDTSNHTVGDNWIFDTRKGLDDIIVSGTYTNAKDQVYLIRINHVGVNFNICDVERDGVLIRDRLAGTGFNCTTTPQELDDGINISFSAATGHTVGDEWIIRAFAERHKNADFMIGCYAEGKTTDAPLDDWLFEINEVRLMLQFLFNGDWPVFAECDGLAYASWIDGRSSNYASTQLIEDPVGICESILRDQLSQATADIDEASFINGENTSVKTRINLHHGNAMSAFDAIRQISEQSTFCFSFGPDAKSRVIDLADKSPTTTRTIHFSHIVKDSIVVGKTSNIRNLLHIDSLWQEEYDDFAEQTTVEDATSTADVGIGDRVYNAKWPNIAGTSKGVVSANLVNSTDGIWSKRHTTLALKTLGNINADLIEGDWIELDAASVDYHIKCYGASWSAKQFLIVNVKQGQKHTTFKAVKLW